MTNYSTKEVRGIPATKWRLSRSILKPGGKIELETTLQAPYMTLGFCALEGILQLKLSDQGLFDGSHFQFVSPQVDSW